NLLVVDRLRPFLELFRGVPRPAHRPRALPHLREADVERPRLGVRQAGKQAIHGVGNADADLELPRVDVERDDLALVPRQGPRPNLLERRARPAEVLLPRVAHPSGRWQLAGAHSTILHGFSSASATKRVNRAASAPSMTRWS